jgi:hypothetical protein
MHGGCGHASDARRGSPWPAAAGHARASDTRAPAPQRPPGATAAGPAVAAPPASETALRPPAHAPENVAFSHILGTVRGRESFYGIYRLAGASFQYKARMGVLRVGLVRPRRDAPWAAHKASGGRGTGQQAPSAHKASGGRGTGQQAPSARGVHLCLRLRPAGPIS